MNKHPLAYPAQSMTEYSVVIALVAVLALPFVLNLQQTLHDMFNSSSSQVSSSLQGVRAGSDTVSSGKQEPVVASDVKAPAVTSGKKGIEDYGTTENLGPYQASYDAKTGQITYKLPEAMGGGSVTTSVEGVTGELSLALATVIDKWRGANGEAAPSDLAEMVKKLASTGQKISAEQATVNKQNIGCTKLGCANTWNLIYATKDYGTQFSDVMTRIDQLGGSYSEIKSIVDGYSGVISTVNYANFLQNTYKYSAGTNQQVYDLVENYSHFGQNVQVSVSAAEAPAVTHYASSEIKKSVDKK